MLCLSGSLKENIFRKILSVLYDFDFTENIPAPVYRKTKRHFQYDVFRKSKLLFPVCQLFYFRYTVFTRSDHYFRCAEKYAISGMLCLESPNLHFRYDEILFLFPFPVAHYKNNRKYLLWFHSIKISLTEQTYIEELT